MEPVRFKGYETILGAPQNWDENAYGPCAGLPIARAYDTCISVWRPTWRERLKFLFGANIILRVASGRTQPPVSLDVRKEP